MDTSSHRISIIIPSFNQGDFIEKTLNSIFNQDYSNLQLIVVDGGSTDGTKKVLEAYRERINVLISEPDKGQADAINKGLRLVDGDIVTWQNSDDLFMPDCFRVAISALEQNPDADGVYGDIQILDTRGSEIEIRHARPYTLEEMLPWAAMYTQCFFFRRRVLNDGHRVDEAWRHHMDQNFYWDLALSGYRFKYIPKVLGAFRIHEKAKGEIQQDVASKELCDLYRKLLLDDRLDLSIKIKVFESLRSLCLDDFGKNRLGLYRRSLKELFQWPNFGRPGLNLILRFPFSFAISQPFWHGVRRLIKSRKRNPQ